MAKNKEEKTEGQESGATAGGSNVVSKITVASVGAQPKPHSIKEGEKKAVCVFYGEARDSKIGQTQFGDFLKFTGNFGAVNMETGERFRSGTLILPAIMENILDSAIKETEGAVQFAIEIGVKHSANGNTGYEYTVRPLLEPSENDPLLMLESKVGTLVKLPALAAPKA
jgi:hypothetical protein